jgi:aspartate/methionine/tyrosine aminotransferase
MGTTSTATFSSSSRSSSSNNSHDSLTSLEVNDEDISSTRGRNAVSLLPIYLTDARSVSTYHPEDEPNGALQLSVAENQMLEDLLVPALRKFSVTEKNESDTDFNGLFYADQIYYQPTHGRPGLRKAMATYLKQILKLSSDHTLDEEGLVLGAGCNAVLENLCFTLTEPGDGVLIPTPYYAAFEFDLVARAGLEIVPVNTFQFHEYVDSSNSISQESYYPNKASLDAAYESSKESGVEPKILLLSHPNNPLGICYPPSVMKECIDWARERKVHLVSDEIYAGSVYEKRNADTGMDTFESALSLAADPSTNTEEQGLGLGPYIHFVYALSKDMALSGLRVGVTYSENKAIRLPMQKLNDLCQISSQTQLTVEKMLSATGDDKSSLWVTNEFLPENNSRIETRSTQLKTCLDECGVPYLHGNSGLFLWIDFMEFLPALEVDEDEDCEKSKDRRERSLYLALLQEFGLLFTPGRSMKNELPGFFRCVFTAASDDEFKLGLKRIKTFVDSRRV